MYDWECVVNESYYAYMASKHAGNSPKLLYIYIITIFRHTHMLHGVVINTKKHPNQDQYPKHAAYGIGTCDIL
jgi:hypothetical protein